MCVSFIEMSKPAKYSMGGDPPIEIPEPILSAPWRAPVPLPHVEKLGDKHRARNNRIRASGCLNRCCVSDSSFESKLPVRTLKIVFQQHRPKAAIDDSERVRSIPA